MFINNLETGLKREKETFFWVLDYIDNKDKKSPMSQAYLAK